MTNKMVKKRLSAEERKMAILKAAVPLFASQGFNGTTTKQLADAAQVSEALLYKYFPSKQEIYRSLREVCFKEKRNMFAGHCGREPSTECLMLQVYTLVFIILQEGTFSDIDQKTMRRLMAHSFLEDGEFAKDVLTHFEKSFRPCFEANLQAAEKSNDLNFTAKSEFLNMWFVHHLTVGFGLLHKIVDYQINSEETITRIVEFSLRGLGLKESAIQKYYKPKKFKEKLQEQFGKNKRSRA